MDRDADRQLIEHHAGARRIALVAESFARLTGRELVPFQGDMAHALWNLPAVVLAHGTEDDPVFFYANRMALDRFVLTGKAIVAMPSRLSAEMPERSEREALFRRVDADGYIDDYAGVRIAATGQRFRIEQATVWNMIDEHGERHGQAAVFSRWTDL
ncbi:MEKHLA domain-containing protein [Croceicoccus bisphenolivorans]|uniref:MEKHLA domain-containing protein n=1 Tax=Croceicoccus bisphenolivorans TaxID=1783232 RepID=UPI00082FA525|nr:MEKHLA domain-containing protein [Croceicoccus bisphenolivorans]